MVNIVCLHFSPECSQLSQSFYFLEYRVKIVYRVHIKLLGIFYILIDENIQICTTSCFGKDYLFLSKVTFLENHFTEMRLKSVLICGL